MEDGKADGGGRQNAHAADEQGMKDLRKAYASVLVLALSGFIIYSLIPYINAFFGAMILYNLLKPVYLWLTLKCCVSRSGSAISVIVFSVFLITVPFLYATGIFLNEVNVLSTDLGDLSKTVDEIGKMVPGLDLSSIINEQLVRFGEMLKNWLVSTILTLSHTLVNITIMYFLLYYMLINQHQLRRIAVTVSPFNEKNTLRLAQEVSNVTRSTLIGQVLVGLLHGALLAAGFHYFGVHQAVFWGFIGAILSMLPVFGTPIIWVPAGVLRLASGDIPSGVGILVWGVILTNADSLARPFIQFKVSKMHPLISIIGFFIGVSYFGLLGIVVGPLLLSYFFLMFEMFKEEYLSRPERHANHVG
jgi:predicted PurR-regulated permease PerM